MSQITLQRLVQAAQSRSIPSFFEYAWEVSRGINPVAVALRIRQNKRYEERAIVGAVLLVCVATSSVLTFILSSEEGWWWGGGSHPWLLLAQWISLAIILVFGASLFLFGLAAMERISEGEIQNVEDFCRDLTAFCMWGGCSLEELANSAGEEKAKEIARNFMIGGTSQVRAHIMTNRDLSNRYDTLLRLGVVPPGGYDRYFKAKKRVQAA